MIGDHTLLSQFRGTEPNHRQSKQTLGFVKRNLWLTSQEIKAEAYRTLIRPTLEYASSGWDPYLQLDINELESIQRRAGRFAMRDYKRDSSVTTMLQTLQWDTLQDRRRKARLTMLHKIRSGLVGIDKDA